MIPTARVNGLTVIHRNSDGVSRSAPDPCLTPSPPAPVGYLNTAHSRDLVKETKTVFVDGEGIATKDSCFSRSEGDEPGTVGGVISGVNMGKATFVTYSVDVFAEGKNVARLGDTMLNNGNAPNTPPTKETQGNKLPADLKQKLCKIFCWCNENGNKGNDFIEKIPYDPSMTA